MIDEPRVTRREPDQTGRISEGTTVSTGPRPPRRRLVEADVAHLDFVEQVFLPEAGCVDLASPSARDDLARLVCRLRAEATHQPPARGAAPAADGTPQEARPSARAYGVPYATGVPGSESQPWTPAPWATARAHPERLAPPEPGPVSRWWSRTRSAVGSDLAVHGLAYLGVLLLFVGAFGLVVFAFGDVAPRLRPVAELLIVLAPFSAAALLLHRGAVVPGRAIEVGGGLLLPIVLVTTFLDGFGLPPDLNGVPLVVALTTGLTLVTLAYGVWAHRHPDSALRHTVAPLVWFTVAMATLGLGRDIPAGEDVATPGSAQVAAIALAILASLVVAHARPSAFLAEPTQVAAVTGTVVVGVMALLSWIAEDWPPVAVGATGALLLGALHLLRPRLPLHVVAAAGPAWTFVVGWGLAVDLEPAQAATATLFAYVVLVEVAGRGRWPGWALRLPAVGALAALVATSGQPWWAVGALSATAAWAVARRVHPYDVPWAAPAFDVAAAVVPLVALVQLGNALDAPAALLVGAGLVLLCAVPATRPVLRRDHADTFWKTTYWVWLAALAGATCLFVVAEGGGFAPTRDGWLVTGTLAVLAVAATVGPAPRPARPWLVVALAASAWLVACATAPAPDLARGSVLAVAGLALVAVAHLEKPGRDRYVRGHLGLVGHVLGVAALTTSGTAWGLVASSGLVTAGWLLTAAHDTADRSPVGVLIARAGPTARYLPPVVAAAGLPLTLALALDRAALLTLVDPWVVVVPAAAGLFYAALTRVRIGERVEVTAAWGGFASALLAAAAGTTRLTVVVGLAAVIATVALVAARRRHTVMVWTAWAAVAPLTGFLAAELVDGFRGLPVETQLAAVLVSVGGAFLVGGWAADLRGRTWAPRHVPSHPTLLPVVAIGAAELVQGLLGSAFQVEGDAGGWLIVVVAASVLVVGLLTRAGALGGVAALLGWAAALRLASPDLETRPWVAVAVAALLLVSAGLLARRQGQAPAWSRWDLSFLLAAAPVAATALAQAVDGGGWYTLTFVLVGLECVAAVVGLRRRTEVAVGLGLVGGVLILVGAADAGPGWVSVTLLAYAVVSSALAVQTTAWARAILQMAGAALASLAWIVALSWLDWPDVVAADVTAAGAGVLSVVAVSALRIRDLDPSWTRVWGGAGAVLTVLGAAAAETMWADGSAAEPSWWVVTGMGLLAFATALAAAPLDWPLARDLSAASAGATALIVLQVLDLGPSGQVAAFVVMSLVAGLAGLVLPEGPRVAVWRRPLLELGCAAAVAAVAVASTQLPDRTLLVPSLAACSLQAAVLGVTLRLLLPQLLSPLLACAAWWAYASMALGGSPQWYTVPLGLSLLVAVGLWRHHRLLQRADAAAPEIVALEVVGIGFLVGSSFTQAVTDEVAYATVAAALGVGVSAWGLVTQVRRRMMAGVLVVVGALVVFVGVPMARLAPAWEGAWLWLLIGGIGAVALLAATMLEEGRRLVERGMRRFTEMTAHWE